MILKWLGLFEFVMRLFEICFKSLVHLNFSIKQWQFRECDVAPLTIAVYKN